jgi:hypothetical protein
MALTSAASLTGCRDGGFAREDWAASTVAGTGRGLTGLPPACLVLAASSSTDRMDVNAVMVFPLLGLARNSAGRVFDWLLLG